MACDPIELHARGLSFSALTAGSTSAPEVVLCLHGFPDHAPTFRAQMGPLAGAGFRVIAPVMRGYEASSQPPDGVCSLMTLACDVVGWLDHLVIERAHLVGHHWGAAVGYTVGAHHPRSGRTLTRGGRLRPGPPPVADLVSGVHADR